MYTVREFTVWQIQYIQYIVGNITWTCHDVSAEKSDLYQAHTWFVLQKPLSYSITTAKTTVCHWVPALLIGLGKTGKGYVLAWIIGLGKTRKGLHSNTGTKLFSQQIKLTQAAYTYIHTSGGSQSSKMVSTFSSFRHLRCWTWEIVQKRFVIAKY